MSYTDYDYEHDRYMADNWERLFREEVLGDFELERLRSYYVANPNLATPAFAQLDRATMLRFADPSASLLLALGALEYGLKLVLLRPLVAGLVHREDIADFVASAFEVRRDRLLRIVLRVLTELTGTDLTQLQRPSSGRLLVREVEQLAVARNRVAHACEPCTVADAFAACQVASFVLEDLTALVLARLGMRWVGATVEV